MPLSNSGKAAKPISIGYLPDWYLHVSNIPANKIAGMEFQRAFGPVRALCKESATTFAVF